MDRYTTDRHDLDLQYLIKRVYEFSRSHPDPEAWLEKFMDLYDADPGAKIESLPFYSYIREDIALVLNSVREKLTRALELTKRPGGRLRALKTFSTIWRRSTSCLSIRMILRPFMSLCRLFRFSGPNRAKGMISIRL